jgi:hypothetical protein
MKERICTHMQVALVLEPVTNVSEAGTVSQSVTSSQRRTTDQVQSPDITPIDSLTGVAADSTIPRPTFTPEEIVEMTGVLTEFLNPYVKQDKQESASWLLGHLETLDGKKSR